MKKRGLTLVEIIVATLILALVMTGLTNLILAGRRHIVRTRSKIQAAELERLFLAPLQMYVRQDTWDQPPVGPLFNNLLTVGNYRSINNPFSTYSSYTVVSWLEEPYLHGIRYYPVYEVTSYSGLRKVKAIISWSEP